MTSATSNGYRVLRSDLERARYETGCSLSDLTVLSAQVDPYRLDTPAGHRDGQWLAEQLDKAIGGSRRIHWRGLHYGLVSGKRSVVKPDGEAYRNTDEDWQWLSGVAGKAARWLGYLPFERIPITATPSRSSIARQGLQKFWQAIRRRTHHDEDRDSCRDRSTGLRPFVRHRAVARRRGNRRPAEPKNSIADMLEAGGDPEKLLKQHVIDAYRRRHGNA
jgi:hypothetical protein